jgi:type II secretory pathway component GspD/PulD (secretin)
VFLSGLKREIDSNSKRSVPGLSAIPVMGEAFITRSKKRETVDLIISVTPYLVEEDAENGG